MEVTDETTGIYEKEKTKIYFVMKSCHGVVAIWQITKQTTYLDADDNLYNLQVLQV